MKQLQRIMFVMLAGVSLGLSAVPTASATTLELGGVKQTGAVALSTTLKSGTSMLIEDTTGFFGSTCTVSVMEGKTSVLTGTKVEGPLSVLKFESCKEEPVVVDSSGNLSIENISGTTNGTVRWIGAKWTMPSPYGPLTCVTGASPGADIGTLTGVKEGNATLNINAALNCGSITQKYTATYSVTSPEGLGVTS